MNGATGEEWLLVFAAGRILLGRDVSFSNTDPVGLDRLRVSPVFDLNVQVQPQPGGAVNVGYHCAPLALLPTLDALEFDRATTVCTRLADLGPEDRRRLMSAVRTGQEIQASMRAQSAGVTLPWIVMPGGGR